MDPEICGTTGFVTYTSPKDFNMESAAVGNPQGASQGQTIDAPISVMFPALKRTLNRAKSTRPEFEVLVSKENGRVLQSPWKTPPSQVVSLSLPRLVCSGCCLILLFLGNWERRLFAKSYPPRTESRPGPEMQHHSQRRVVGRLRGSREGPSRVSSNSGKAFH